MSIERLIDLKTDCTEAIGTTVSPVVESYDGDGQYVWAVDIDLGDGSEILKNVPIATNNKDIYYTDQGKPVSLRKENGHWVVVGLSKTVRGFMHVSYVCFADDIAQVIGEEMQGYRVRALTYGELGSLLPGTGYGYFPYGVMGRFDYDGNLVEILEMR